MDTILTPDEQATSLLAKQHSTISGRQAVALGLTRRQVRTRIATGRWLRQGPRRVRPGRVARYLAAKGDGGLPGHRRRRRRGVGHDGWRSARRADALSIAAHHGPAGEEPPQRRGQGSPPPDLAPGPAAQGRHGRHDAEPVGRRCGDVRRSFATRGARRRRAVPRNGVGRLGARQHRSFARWPGPPVAPRRAGRVVAGDRARERGRDAAPQAALGAWRRRPRQPMRGAGDRRLIHRPARSGPAGIAQGPRVPRASATTDRGAGSATRRDTRGSERPGGMFAASRRPTSSRANRASPPSPPGSWRERQTTSRA